MHTSNLNNCAVFEGIFTCKGVRSYIAATCACNQNFTSRSVHMLLMETVFLHLCLCNALFIRAHAPNFKCEL